MAQSQQPLALTDVAHSEQKGWRRNQHLVDSLPYVDGLTPAEKQAVDKLIEEEVRPHCAASCSRRLQGLPAVPPPAAATGGGVLAVRWQHRRHHRPLALACFRR